MSNQYIQGIETTLLDKGAPEKQIEAPSKAYKYYTMVTTSCKKIKYVPSINEN